MLRQQIPVDDAVDAFGAGEVERVGGEFHEDFAGKGVVPHVQVGNFDRELVRVIASGKSGKETPQRLVVVLIRGPVHRDNTTNCPTANSHTGPARAFLAIKRLVCLDLR